MNEKQRYKNWKDINKEERKKGRKNIIQNIELIKNNLLTIRDDR